MTAKEWDGDFDPMSDPEERKHILSVLDSFRYGCMVIEGFSTRLLM